MYCPEPLQRDISVSKMVIAGLISRVIYSQTSTWLRVSSQIDEITGHFYFSLPVLVNLSRYLPQLDKLNMLSVLSAHGELEDFLLSDIVVY